MKSKIWVGTLALIVSCTMAFAQNKTMSDNKDSLTAKKGQPKDSVYFGCVPCCQKCSVFRTDKPGECPNCGMTLEKRTYTIDAKESKSNIQINKNACKYQHQ